MFSSTRCSPKDFATRFELSQPAAYTVLSWLCKLHLAKRSLSEPTDRKVRVEDGVVYKQLGARFFYTLGPTVRRAMGEPLSPEEMDELIRVKTEVAQLRADLQEAYEKHPDLLMVEPAVTG